MKFALKADIPVIRQKEVNYNDTKTRQRVFTDRHQKILSLQKAKITVVAPRPAAFMAHIKLGWAAAGLTDSLVSGLP
ncbi:MAG: hypothetical protein ACLR23_26275 [Clostridia bacterium]